MALHLRNDYGRVKMPVEQSPRAATFCNISEHNFALDRIDVAWARQNCAFINPSGRQAKSLEIAMSMQQPGNASSLKPTATAQHRILIVEDDGDIASMLVDLVRGNGFEAASVANGVEMDRILTRHKFDLVLLDGMLPGEDGFSICRRLRASGKTPILMLTALREDIDRILGLELGADDYVTKPFNSRELMARIKNILRRAFDHEENPDALAPLMFSGWRIDPNSRELFDADGAQVSMTTAEFDLLWAFCRHPNKVLTREQLLAMTHAGSAGPVERSIDAHISRVRQKIEPNLKDPTFIKTVRLGGYLFASKVEPLT